MTTAAKIAPEYLLFGGAALLSLLAFTVLILVPAISSYGRGWEKATVGFLSIFVLVALIALGIAAGALIVYNWSEINKLLEDIGDIFSVALPSVR
ncbi:MAG TPA: hypothetical protein VFY99_09460 [Solirubrobacterales bacterium]